MEIKIVPDNRAVIRISLSKACALVELSEMSFIYNKSLVNINIVNLILLAQLGMHAWGENLPPSILF